MVQIIEIFLGVKQVSRVKLPRLRTHFSIAFGLVLLKNRLKDWIGSCSWIGRNDAYFSGHEPLVRTLTLIYTPLIFPQWLNYFHFFCKSLVY